VFQFGRGTDAVIGPQKEMSLHRPYGIQEMYLDHSPR
jgi:hypothetical protein